MIHYRRFGGPLPSLMDIRGICLSTRWRAQHSKRAHALMHPNLVLSIGILTMFLPQSTPSTPFQIDQEWGRNDMKASTDSLTAIFVIHKAMTSFAKKVMVTEHQRRNQGNTDSGIPMVLSFNVFFEAELVVNITEHIAVPKHRVLKVSEKKSLLTKYHVSEDQLPRILITDPVAKYFGLRRGEIVEIIRDSATAGRYTTYRICL